MADGCYKKLREVSFLTAWAFWAWGKTKGLSHHPAGYERGKSRASLLWRIITGCCEDEKECGNRRGRGLSPRPSRHTNAIWNLAECYRKGIKTPPGAGSFSENKHNQHAMIKHQQAHCPHCKALRHFRKRNLNHLAHLAATVFTFGLWSVPWLAVTIHHSRKPWRCTFCGCRMQPPAPSPAKPFVRLGQSAIEANIAPW